MEQTDGHFDHPPVARKPEAKSVASSFVLENRSAARSGGSLVFDCANDRREYGTAGASGDRL